MKIEGRIWMVEKDGKLINDIDTDMIYHNSYLHVMKKNEMAKYAFSNLEGWQNFPEKAKMGDIIIAGENFGCGSSRQHAVECFLALGVQAIIAKSFGAIYKRNAINSALAIIEWPEADKFNLKSGDTLAINLDTEEVKKEGKTISYSKPMNPVQTAIYKAGGLFLYSQSI